MTDAARSAAGAEAHEAYLAPTPFLDYDDGRVRRLAEEVTAGQRDPTARAVALYYRVRDDYLYDPYRVDLSEPGFRASRVIETGRGFCITKAVLLAALARAAGIPARLGFADVRNHLATARLRELMGGTDIFLYHGYADLWLDGRWVKATPAFTLSLCQKFRVLPLEFDGTADSIFHPFDANNRRHMEYVRDRGTYADVPFADILREFRATYPYLREAGREATGDFAADAERETH